MQDQSNNNPNRMVGVIDEDDDHGMGGLNPDQNQQNQQKNTANVTQNPNAGESGGYPVEEDNRMKDSNYQNFPQNVKTPSAGPEYTRVEPPSHFVPYDFDNLQIRKLNVRDLSKIYQATTDESFSVLVDSIDDTINQNVRELTIQDFYFILYWQRIHSYPKSPFSIVWDSRYGNKNEFQVNDTNLTFKEINSTKEDYQQFKEKGLDLPRVSDTEILEMEDLSKQDQFMAERAKFLTGNSMKEKIQKLENHQDLTILDDISSFNETFQHGVEETVEVYDKKFEPNSAVEVLESSAKRLRDGISDTSDMTMDQVQYIMDEVIDREKEAEQIRNTLKEGGTPQPRSEELTISINALRFFPNNK